MRLLLALLVAGCAIEPEPQYRWVKDGSNSQQFDMEFAQCEERAISASPAGGLNRAQSERGMAIFGSCMRGKGWNLIPR